MAKKFVRGITGIKTINKQDLDTNNVNDLLSDGQHNFIHRKKGNSEEYHNLTNNIKTIQSDDTDLLTVTNYNNTTNSATIRPKHDSQKEQLLESTYNTILINHGENGTDETTIIDVNDEILVEYLSDIFQVKTQTYRKEYTHSNAVLHTQVTPLLDNNYWDFYLFLNMHKGQTQATFELMSQEKRAFTYLINQYGENNKLDINGVEFTLNNYVLSVTTNNATNNPFLTSFSTLVVGGVS